MKRLLMLFAAIAGSGCTDGQDGNGAMQEQRRPQRTSVRETDPRFAPQRLRMMEEIRPIGRRLRTSGDPTFSGIWFEHEPEFRIVIAFTDGRPRAELLKSLSPETRRHVEFRKAKRSRREIAQDLDAITAAVKTMGVDYVAGYRPKTERFEITVGSSSAAAQVLKRLPERLRADTGVVVGSVPVRLSGSETAPAPSPPPDSASPRPR